MVNHLTNTILGTDVRMLHIFHTPFTTVVLRECIDYALSHIELGHIVGP